MDRRTEAAIGELASLCPDQRHAKRVTALSLQLFDSLQALHGFGGRERDLLEAAARLHDVGWSDCPGKGHHKRSLELILERAADFLGEDLELCALVARYHTKAEPDPERHGRFAKLGKKDRRLVEWLAGLLRVADGLDCSHGSRVSRVASKVLPEEIILSPETSSDASPEKARAGEKAGLLAKVSGRRIRID